MKTTGKQTGKGTDDRAPSVLDTVDEFVRIVPWGRRRVVFVFRRHHAGRTFIRLRTWNRHRAKRVWYPTKRSFVIPIDHADALARAIQAAARGETGRKPGWLVRRELAERQRLEWLETMQAPQTIVRAARKSIGRQQRARA